jgi:NADPH-dependent glutamate synthase beta subunit-like oxidoreductase
MSNIFISRLIRLPQQSLRFGSGRGRLRSEGLLGVSSWKVDGWGTATCRLDRRHLSSTVDGSNDEEERGVPPLLSVAIVGTGPSGFYTAKYLRAAAEKMNVDARIDLIERLPTPYGLVRSGVAPDHPEVKNVENDFRLMFTEHPESFHFVGNVNVGRDVSLDELRQFYQVVVLAYGCESDRKLGIEGEDTLHGVLSAREFVAWYNGKR